MAGGGGGGGYFPTKPEALKLLIEDARAEEARQRLEREIGVLLGELLAGYSHRDYELIGERLDELEDVLGESASLDRMLFGGSVGKRTFVDGLSDVDALVVLSEKEYADKAPGTVLDEFYQALNTRISRENVISVVKGQLAITIKYRDGQEIQLLPALKAGNKVAIPASDGRSWNETRPRRFQTMLTRANERLNGNLVPTIKLVKAAISRLPEQKRLSGYHVEALCIEAVKGYRGTKTVKALLVHALSKGATRVLQPIQDVTKQSRSVDAYLGRANSTERRVAADALRGLARRLKTATSVEDWSRVFSIDG